MQKKEKTKVMADNSQRTTGAKQKTSKSKSKIIIFAIEILLILIMLAVLFFVMTKTGEGPKVVELDKDNLGINEAAQDDNQSGDGTVVTGTQIVDTGYTNIALFGVDATTPSGLYKGSRSDCIMIASINMDTGDIKLVSVYRDTYLNLGTDTYNKCNHAYSGGGAEQAIKMLNMNLDLDITNFIAVNYQSLIDLIDGLGGIYIDVDKNELKHINNYQITINKDLNLGGYTPVTETGYQKLNGLQATAYCRIRYDISGGDFGRASNQREVIKAIEEQAKKTDAATLTKVFTQVVDEIYTSIDSKDLLELVSNINNYRIVDEGGFPEESMRTTGNIGAKGSCVIPLDLESNVVWLHQFLFEDADYTVSSTVKECSDKVKEDTSKYINR
jgi:LCP family protein required for cell wall assembly